MATVTVNINATDNMSPVLAALQQQLNQLQQQANINLRGAMNNTMNYTQRLFENMLNSFGTKLWKQFTNNLKSAYDEIKAIDDELVVVRRVTGKTNDELAGMTKNAMKVAQAYGVSASKYLSGVADFTRAGYRDQAEGLAELSVKLQRSGDVSADVANQYILAIDKAYGLQGNIEALTAAMDGANQIGNEYATNVAEISAGIGKIATIASTAHIGIDELTAALGTITAVTQRSGTEAATALRAIFLNIMGDTTTEIEDGAKWTAGEIEGLRDVLELYAPEVVRAAEATGTLINPMEAIGALAKSYQAGILTESKLFSMVNDIGGKLRTNQLMVLIKRWDIYESMLATFANASGSIDREVANSLDSITVKTEQLKASWVALVNDTISTQMIKGVLDGLNGAVQAVGNLGNALAIVLGLVTALKAQRLATLTAGLFRIQNADITGMTRAVRGIGTTIALIGVALSAVNAAVNNYNSKIEEAQKGAVQTGQKAAQSSNEILALYNSYVTAKAGSEGYTTALIALAEALGLTASQAKEAEGNIRQLTLQQLKDSQATARAALLDWNRQQHDQYSNGMIGFIQESVARAKGEVQEYVVQLADMPQEIRQIFAEELGFSNERQATYLRALYNQDADIVVQYYERAKDLKNKLDQYTNKAKIDISGLQGYKMLSEYLQDNKDDYDQAKASLDAYVQTVVPLLLASLPGYDTMEKMMKDIASGAQEDEKALAGFAAEWEKMISSITDDAYDGAGKWIRESLIGIMQKDFPKIYAEWLKLTEFKGADNMSKDTDKATDSVKKLAEALSTATKAKQAFDAAMAQGAENEGFKNYQDAYAAYAEEMKAGRVGSRKAMAAAQYLMAGSDLYNFDALYQAGGYKAVNKAMSNMPFKTLYGGENNEYGEGFLNALSKLAKGKNGEIKLNDKVVASYKKVGEQVDFTVEDLWGLADALNISPDQVWQSIKALSVYGEVDSDVGRVKKTLQELGKTAGVTSDEFDNLTIDYEKMLQYARQSGMNEQQWGGLKQWMYKLSELGEAQILNVPDVEGGWQNYADLTKDAAEKAKEAEGSAKEAEESMGAAAEAAEGTEAPAVGTGSAAVADPAQAMYDEYNRVLAEIDKLIASKDYTITFNADGWPAIHTIEALETESGEVTRERTIQFNADGAVIYTLDVMKNKAGEVAETREIQYDVNGNVTSILSTLYDDAGRVAETRTITYNADGTINNIDVVKADATNPELLQHFIYYYTDGKVDHLEWVEETANGLVTHEFKVNYGTDGSINGLTETYKTAEGVQHKEYQFIFGADGKLLETKVSSYMEFADGTTSAPIEYTLSADDGPAFDEVGEILAFIQGNYTDKSSTYTLDANNDPAENAMLQTVEEIAASTGGNYGKYTLDADNKSALAAIKEVEDRINQLLPDHKLNYSKGNTLTDALYNATLEALHGSELLSEAQRSYYTAAQHTVEYYYDENGKPVEKSTQIDDKGNGTVTYTHYDNADLQTITGQEVYDVADGVVVPGSVKFDKVTDEEIEDQTGIEDVEVKGGTWVPDTASFEVEPDPIEPSGPETHYPWDNAVQSIKDFFSGKNRTKQEPPPGEFLPWTTTVNSIKEWWNSTGKKNTEVALGQNPVELPVSGMKLSEDSHGNEEGTIVYTAQFEVDGGNAVMDVLTEINEEQDKVHRIKVLTQADGTQVIEEFIGDLNGVGDTHTITIDAEGNAATDLENIDELLDMIDRTISLSVNANTSDAQGRLNKIRNTLDEIKSKTVTVTTIEKTQSQSSSKPEQYDKNAKGTDYFKGGYSLINEEGPELVAGNGLAQIYAHGFPTIAKIPRGARIYNARETAQLLGGTMSLPAYASGTNNSNVNSDFAKGLQAALNFLSTGSTTSMSDITGGTVGPTDAHLTIPKNTKEEEKKEEEKKSSGGGGSSRKSEQEEKAEEDEDEFWDTIKEYIDYGLKKIQYQIDDYQDDITAIERARDALLKPIEEELEDLDYSLSMLQYEVTLLERARDDAVKPLDKEIERLEKARDLSKEEYDLEEKRKALEDARHQRTIRYFNEESGQWEWMADQQAIQEAEKAYNDALADHEIAMLKRERDAIYDSFQEQIDAFEEQEETLERRQEDLEHERTKIEYEYGESIDPIQDQLDALQQTYDDLDKYYQRLVDAVEVPMESLTAALKEMASAGKGYTAQLANTTQLLDALYSLAPTWSAVGLTDIGKYVPDQRQYGGTGAGVGKIDQSTNVYVEKMQIEGNDAKTIGDILKKSKLYSERR